MPPVPCHAQRTEKPGDLSPEGSLFKGEAGGYFRQVHRGGYGRAPVPPGEHILCAARRRTFDRGGGRPGTGRDRMIKYIKA